MKKLMVAACAVAFAAVAQAATINWTIDTYICSETDTAIGSDAIAYVFDAIGGSYTAADMTTLISSTKGWETTFASAANLGSGLSEASADNALNLSGSIAYDDTEKLVNTYMVVFDAATVGNASKFYVVDYGERALTDGDIGSATIAFGDEQTITGATSTWTSVYKEEPGPEPTPEPTSGLLMLLGMGVLALRRRRA